MSYLLDTHIWIWSLMSPARLAERVRETLLDPENELWLSPVSVWELVILVEKGRLRLNQDVNDWLDEAAEKAPLKEAYLTFEIARQSRQIDVEHEDPADRFLAATAKVMGLTLVTGDRRLRESGDIDVLANE